MMIAATDDTDVNSHVFNDAENRGMLVNVVDVPPLCNFILPAIIRSGRGDRHLHRRRFTGAGQADEARGRRSVRRGVRGPSGDPERRARLGKRTLPTYNDRKAFSHAIVYGDPYLILLLREGRGGRGPGR